MVDRYVKYMRQQIGHNPFIVCTCGCLIFNDKGQVLLQKRSDNGKWGNPGGCMEMGETIQETVIREIKEETGLDVKEKDLKIFAIYSGERQHCIYPNQDEAYFVNIIFETKRYSNALTVDDESLELKFFDIDKLPDNVTDAFIQVKEDLIKNCTLHTQRHKKPGR